MPNRRLVDSPTFRPHPIDALRTDVVLFINGIAIGVFELKNSRTSIGHGIRQNLSNQQREFNDFDHIRYFCGNTEVSTDLKAREPQRAAVYKAIASLLRSFANIADEISLAGYSDAERARLKERVNHFVKLREVIRNAAGETLDLKAYEADMRHLIDTYIEADEPRKISDFDEMGILEIITKSGLDKVIAHLSNQLGGNQTAIAETIENNVRSKIVTEQLSDPAYFERMSKLLDEVIAMRRSKAIEYEEYLTRIGDLARRVELGGVLEAPSGLNTRGKLAVYNQLVKILTQPSPSAVASGSVAENPPKLRRDKLNRLPVRQEQWSY